ncbi:hypothetical protein [Streptomyces sp. NPDC002490]|uniref:hypothetical protein n=1 Tax=Streptomyces sp. NPDC002490 TaxID=3154416 RepID=UPI0033302961
MDQVDTDGSPLSPTGHPLQRAGARAVAALAGRARPEGVTDEDLDAVAARIVADVLIAATAAKDAVPYDWWKVLFALYPNAKATHSKRSKDPEALRPDIEALFRRDEPAQVPGALPDHSRRPGTVRPCTFCGTSTAVLWTKSKLPLYDTDRALNTLPPGVPGWPVCRGCRIAMWALPYGAHVTAGSATVLSCEDEGVEREFVTGNVLRAHRVRQLGFGDRSTAGDRPELVTLRALRAVRDAGFAASTLWSFKNDNQDPWLRVTRTRRAVPAFLSVVDGNAVPRRGWRLLEIALTRVDRSGAVTARGAAEAARLLFETEDGRSGAFLAAVHRLIVEPDRRRSATDRAALSRLAHVYAEEILGMEPDLTPVTTLLVEWIEHGSGSPRGRFAEYRNAALNDYRLGRLLMQAQHRLLLDGRRAPGGPEDWAPLLQKRPRAWELRMLLSAAVVQELQARGVAVNESPVDPEEQERTDALLARPILDVEDPAGYDDEHDENGAA